MNEIVNEVDKVNNDVVNDTNTILSESEVAKKRQQEFIKDYYI